LLYILSLLLQFSESGDQLVSFVEEFSHLIQQYSVGEKKAAVLVIVAEIRVFVVGLHQYYYR
jgi:hypothetical protein